MIRVPALALAALLAEAALAADAGAVVVRFENIAQPRGVVMVALFDEAGYRKRGSEAVAAAQVAVSGPTARAELGPLRAGRYGLQIFHDVNGDGKLNTNALGIPIEPVAFSNNAPMRFGPARWEAAAFEVKAGETLQIIRFK